VGSLEEVMYVDPFGRGWTERGLGSKGFCHSFAPQSGDSAILFYTSGTTGPPKGCMMSQKSCAINLERIREAWGITREDRLMHVLPLNHGHGLYVALTGCLLAGCFILMKERFDPEDVLLDIDKHQLTLFMGVPTHYHRFLQVAEKERFSLKSMRLFISGSAPLSEQDFNDFQKTFGHTVLERYGMTEIGIHLSNPLAGRRLAGKVGFPLPGTEARVTDVYTGQILEQNQVGELEVRGPNVFSGYWRKPEETEKSFKEGGWFKTGDLVKVDENGYFSIVGRVKDLIISGGLNISPLEVEKVLNTHASVLESAVIGVPNRDFGERVVAYLVLKEGGETPSLKEIQDTCREHLASYKKPKEIYVVDQLPRNTLGKVLKKELRTDYARKRRFGV
jgi:malonyl-CoA/methylmalonyl-CoA synthetase